MYSKEKRILTISWITGTILLLVGVPSHKRRHAEVSFLFTQIITWFFGLMVSEKNLIQYPIRLFKKATKASFTFEYFIFPTVNVFFNVYFPKDKRYKLLHYLIYTSLITGLEIYFERYTNLIKYIKWKWQYTFLTIWITLFISRIYSRWFFRKEFKNI